jgi:hypothetical protein
MCSPNTRIYTHLFLKEPILGYWVAVEIRLGNCYDAPTNFNMYHSNIIKIIGTISQYIIPVAIRFCQFYYQESGDIYVKTGEFVLLKKLHFFPPNS